MTLGESGSCTATADPETQQQSRNGLLGATISEEQPPPDFRCPGESLRKPEPLSRGGEKEWRWQWRLDNGVTVQGVHFGLHRAVYVLAVIFFIPHLIVLKGVPFSIRVEAVLLHQELKDRQTHSPHIKAGSGLSGFLSYRESRTSPKQFTDNGYNYVGVHFGWRTHVLLNLT